MSAAETIQLRSGKEMPVIGLGGNRGPLEFTCPPFLLANQQEFAFLALIFSIISCNNKGNILESQLGSDKIIATCLVMRTSKLSDNAGSVLEVAFCEGYRLIDCAAAYNNETEIGEALQSCFKEGVVKREDIFVTSKLVSSPDRDVFSACHLTLKNLKLDYLDLYLMHSPMALAENSNHPLQDEHKLGYDSNQVAHCWVQMEELVKRGLVKAIGISNFSITKTERLLRTAEIIPAVNQVECHPHFQQQKLKEYCDSKGIILECFYPLGGKQRQELFNDPVLQDVAGKHGISVAQVCIAYGIHRGSVVIPRSMNASRMAENYRSTEVNLDAEDMEKIRNANRNTRYFSGSFLIKTGQDADELIWDVNADSNHVIP